MKDNDVDFETEKDIEPFVKKFNGAFAGT